MFVVLTFIAGLMLYLYGLFLGAIIVSGSDDFYKVMIITVIGGLVSLGLGSASVLVFGGVASLKLVEFISRFTRAKHALEPIEEDRQTPLQNRVSKQAMAILMPLLIFVLSTSLAWDIHNLHDPRTSIFHGILHALDIFSKPITSEPVSYSMEIILVMIVLVAIAGIVPSLVFPYFRKFKITGINSGPFHTDLLIATVGLVTGLGVILTLIGLVFEVMWVGTGPYYYHYVIPVMIGLSLHFTIGMFIGRDRSEEMVKARLEAHKGKRVVKGSVNIQVSKPEGTSISESTEKSH